MQLVLQIAGSLLILAGYALTQFKLIQPTTFLYLGLNVVGSGVLGILAVISAQWGFALLECVWSLVSLVGLVARIRRLRLQKLR
jgi:hypothetical protein